MLIRVCDNCEKQLEGLYLEDVCLTVRKYKVKILQVAGRDFCSYGCLEEYTEERVKAQYPSIRSED